ncbi:hypothetical protein V5799_020650 [Amblyomma americanum]|uniref:Uncharacterized protein n=1 Tax=Amblyomma americanum TaxID=6943 RepID=A0AAQ4ETH2_AMBAM
MEDQSYTCELHQPQAPWSISLARAQLSEGEWLHLLDLTLCLEAMPVGIQQDYSSKNITAFTGLMQRRHDLMPSCRIFAIHHPCEVDISDGKAEHAGLHKHLDGLGVDAVRKAIVSRTQRAVPVAAFGLHHHRGESDCLVQLVVNDATARLPHLATGHAVRALMYPQRLRHLVSASPGEHAVRHGQLDGVGVGARHKTIVVRTQRMAVCRPHGHHLGGRFLELAVDCAAAILLLPAATPAANPQVDPLRFQQLDPELLETKDKPSRAMAQSVGTPRSLAEA